MKTYPITCEECGLPFQAKRVNTKVCALCRILRDMDYMADTKYECWRCQTKFAPVHSKDRACGEHTYKRLAHGETRCAVC